MIDLHAHILPGLDDGARGWDETLTMARMAVQDSIRGVVCTPHWNSGLYENGRERVLRTVEELRMRLREHSIGLEVYPGAELRLDARLPEHIDDGRLLTLNDTGRYALVELPMEVIPLRVDDLFYELQSRSITPVLAHPERNFALMKDPARLHVWVQAGVLTQVTAASLLGRFGPEVRRFTLEIMEHAMAHVLATDTHGPGTRTPHLSEAVREAERVQGERGARAMVLDTPRKIIEGVPVSGPEPVPFGRSSFVKRFFSFFRAMNG
jgi:protein-tyrosine phosphatase